MPMTRTRLPKAQFRQEYRGLYHVFKGSYVQYREHNVILDETNPGISTCV